MFSFEFWEIFKNTFFAEHLRATASKACLTFLSTFCILHLFFIALYQSRIIWNSFMKYNLASNFIKLVPVLKNLKVVSEEYLSISLQWSQSHKKQINKNEGFLLLYSKHLQNLLKYHAITGYSCIYNHVHKKRKKKKLFFLSYSLM